MYAQPDFFWQQLYTRLVRRVDTEHPAWESFLTRLKSSFSELLTVFLTLYGQRPDAAWELEELIIVLFESVCERHGDGGGEGDADNDSHWYLDKNVIGAMCYIERFAGTVSGVTDRLDYLEELGIRYLHLMPPFLCPAKRNDGGYAVSSYREIRPDLGGIADLRELAREMHARGMKLVLDFVFNHTSDEHEWARKALSGDPRYTGHYFFFPDRRLPDRYDANLREIFPEGKRGSFVYHRQSRQWVWSTFNPYQWDLDYRNPVVFRDMVGEMLFLSNLGVDVLRLDALAFTWKEPGTSCENLPRVHTLIRAFRAAARIAAPSLVFKSEAIVHPDEVVKYADVRECALSYNPLFMALSWESVATRTHALLSKSLRKRYRLPTDCVWVNYVRSHDDIGWTFADEDAAELAIQPQDHRLFLNRFFTDRFPGSYAEGLPFQLNPVTGDCRVCGTTASLTGIAKGLRSRTADELALGVKRALLLHALMFTAGGIPLLYLGDEYGQLNDYSFSATADIQDDSRWVHRPYFDWTLASAALRDEGDAWRVELSQGIRSLIRIRADERFPEGVDTDFVDLADSHTLGISRTDGKETAFGVFNVSETARSVTIPPTAGVVTESYDAWSSEFVRTDEDVFLEPLGFRILLRRSAHDEVR